MTRSQNGSSCPVCGKPRHTKIRLGGSDYTVGVMCDCERREYLDGLKRQEEQEKARRRNRAFETKAQSRCFFPDKDDSEAMRACRSYAESFDEMSKGAYGLLLYGRPDQGKTFLGACITNALIDKGVNAIMRSVPNLVAKTRGYGDDGMDELERADLLILDDLGAERDTSFANEVVYRAVESRYSNGKPMIVTTNLTMQEFSRPQTIEQERIYNRILERCLPVKVETGRKRASADTFKEIKGILGV